MSARTLLFLYCIGYVIITALKSQAQSVNSDLSNRLRRSIDLRFEDRNLINMTNIFYETLYSQSSEVMYLSLHVILEDRRNGDIYANFILPPTQKSGILQPQNFGRIQLRKDITLKTINNIDAKIFYDSHSASYDIRRLYQEFKGRQFWELVRESLQIHFSQDRNIFEEVFKYLSEALEGDEYNLPPNPTEFFRSLANLLSKPEFKNLPPDLQYKWRFIVDKANDLQYIKSITFNLRDIAKNLAALKRKTPILFLQATRAVAIHSSQEYNKPLVDWRSEPVLNTSYGGMISFLPEKRNSWGSRDRFYITGFYERTNSLYNNKVFVSPDFVSNPTSNRTAYEITGPTRLLLTSSGFGIAFVRFFYAGGNLRTEIGGSRIEGAIDFSPSNLTSGFVFKKREVDAVRRSSISPYFKVSFGIRVIPLNSIQLVGIFGSLKYTYANLKYKDGLEVYKNGALGEYEITKHRLNWDIGISLSY